MAPCPFCNLPPERIVRASAHVRAIRSSIPVSPGHLLLVPRRHVASLFGLNIVEWVELGQLLVEARSVLMAEFKPEGFNIWVNDGAIAGQTVMHLHLHLVPRYRGQQMDSCGDTR